MKKMVCEICESQRIKKENGVFICQECGAEYSLEEAKTLLKEVDGNDNVSVNDIQDSSNPNASIINNKENKYILLKRLYAWAQVIPVFDEVPFWFSGHHLLPCINDEERFLEFKENLKTNTKKHFYDIDDEFVKDLFTGRGYLNRFNSYSEMCNFFGNIYAYNYHGLYREEATVRMWEKHLKKDNKLFKECEHKLLYERTYITGWDINKYKRFIAINNKTGKEYIIDLDIVTTKLDVLYEIANNIDSIEFYENVEEIVQLPKKWYQQAEYRKQIMKVKTNEIDCLRKYCEFFNEYISQLRKRHEEIKKYYSLNFDNEKQVFIDSCELICQLENEFNLPYEYRNEDAIIKLIKIIEQGRADNWKETINIFKSEQFSTKIVSGIAELKTELLSISENLISIRSQLYTLESNISEKINESNNALNQLSRTASNIFNQTIESKQLLKQIMFDNRFSLLWNL